MAYATCSRASSRLTVDLDALCANYAIISRRIAPATCGAVVKADAYGLGARPVVRALRGAGCKQFFVAHLAEALTLTPQLGPECEVFVLNGLDAGREAECAGRGVVPVLNSLAQVESWRGLAITLQRRLPAALQIDTGMSRLGLPPDEAVALNETSLRDDVDLRLIMTHLACADEMQRGENRDQLHRFDSLIRLFPGVAVSIANSGGVFLAPEYHKDVARCGIALFGVPPSAQSFPLRPVVRLDAPVIQMRSIDAGTGVGYGLDHIASRPMRIATVGIGYADGVPRSFSKRGAAWYRGHRLPVVGRISMDSLTLDATDLRDPSLCEGTLVELIGPHQPIEAVAEALDTIPYEILTGLGQRHQRIYLGDILMEHDSAESSS